MIDFEGYKNKIFSTKYLKERYAKSIPAVEASLSTIGASKLKEYFGTETLGEKIVDNIYKLCINDVVHLNLYINGSLKPLDVSLLAFLKDKVFADVYGIYRIKKDSYSICYLEKK